MTKDIEREAFLEYWRENNLPYEGDDADKEKCFEYWQAAKAHEAEKLKGCVVVPVEPTEAMIEAGNDANECGSWPHEIYAAMLEAARGGNE